MNALIMMKGDIHMRLGGPVFKEYNNPEEWIKVLKEIGYSAAYCPVEANMGKDVIQSYKKAAAQANIVIAEVGAWSNPLSSDSTLRKQALEHCKTQLTLAETIGARCCVNISGSRGEQWDGPHIDNFTDETFDMIVETVREILDAVKPDSTYYALEPMPWIFPDNADDYLRLVKAIDRNGFGVHLDPVNVINSPRRFYNNSLMLKEWFTKLGPYIRSAHAKDIMLSGSLTVHLDEVRPGLGALDYQTYITELHNLNPDIPMMIEHLNSEIDHIMGIKYIRDTAANIHIPII